MYPGETLTIDLEPSIEELLEVGLTRLESKSTWKLWKSDDQEFLDADSFRWLAPACLPLPASRNPSPSPGIIYEWHCRCADLDSGGRRTTLGELRYEGVGSITIFKIVKSVHDGLIISRKLLQ